MLTKKQRIQEIDDKIAQLEPKTHILASLVRVDENNPRSGHTTVIMKEAVEARQQINKLLNEKRKILKELEKSE
ncbi:MAG: hypothetical protein M1114_02985 [Candidatus Dependentiae bacterium]|nr:hypothetical protein [Candidatus Dependentiae bacterium]